MTPRVVRLLLWLAVSACGLATTAGISHAQDGCDDLAANATYEQLADDGAAAASEGRLDDALEAFRQAQAICPYDPTVTFYLARTRQLQNKCEAAVDLYLQAKTQLASGLVPTPAALGDAIDEKLEETRTTCKATGSQRILCADEVVSLSIDGGAPMACPAELELELGAYQLTASRPGVEPYTTTLSIAAGANRDVNIPPLTALPGRLRVSCPDGLDEVVLADATDGVQTVACGDEVALAPGAWSVRVPGSELRREVEITSDTSSTVTMTLLPDESPGDDGGLGGLGIGGLVTAGLGVALLGGGVALHVVAQGQVDDITESMTLREASEQQDDAESLNTVGVVLMGVGGAAIATGVALLIVDLVGSEDGGSMATAVYDGERAMFVLGTRF